MMLLQLVDYENFVNFIKLKEIKREIILQFFWNKIFLYLRNTYLCIAFGKRSSRCLKF